MKQIHVYLMAGYSFIVHAASLWLRHHYMNRLWNNLYINLIVFLRGFAIQRPWNSLL